MSAVTVRGEGERRSRLRDGRVPHDLVYTSRVRRRSMTDEERASGVVALAHPSELLRDPGPLARDLLRVTEDMDLDGDRFRLNRRPILTGQLDGEQLDGEDWLLESLGL